MLWLRKNFPKVILNDTWWQTDNGWPIATNLLNQDLYGPVYPTMPGSVTKCLPGWNVRLVDSNGIECDRN